MSNPRLFRYFKISPEIICLTVMLYVRCPLSLRNIEDLLHERGIDITHETVRVWWNRFGTIFASEIRQSRVLAMRHFRHRRWHLDEVFVKIHGTLELSASAILWGSSIISGGRLITRAKCSRALSPGEVTRRLH